MCSMSQQPGKYRTFVLFMPILNLFVVTLLIEAWTNMYSYWNPLLLEPTKRKQSSYSQLSGKRLIHHVSKGYTCCNNLAYLEGKMQGSLNLKNDIRYFVLRNLCEDIRLLLRTCTWKTDRDSNMKLVLSNWNV